MDRSDTTASNLAGRRILVIDPDRFVREAIGMALEEADAAVIGVGTEPEAIEAFESDPDLAGAVIGLAEPLTMLQSLRRRHRRAAFVAISEFPSVEAAVAAMREGADDVLVKPVVDRELVSSLTRALGRRQMLGVRMPSTPAAATPGLDAVLGDDPRMRRVHELVRTAGATRATVLMNGESGTGKSLVARAIHHASPRADGPFVEIACGSIPETLLESELFGHVAGAFTGAHVDKVGRFLAAHGGTLFLDEINSASPAMQLKLLRVLQERCFEPVGSNDTCEVDVRIVLASNQPLEDLVADGRFRQDLYYRINVVTIDLPPLRERRGDIQTLAEAFRARFAEDHQRTVAGFEPDALDRLLAYDYPGNVRELENAIERGVVLCPGHLLRLADLPDAVRLPPSVRSVGDPASRTGTGSLPAFANGLETGPISLEDALREPERQAILAALASCGGNRTRAASALGIDRTTLYKKLKSLGIDAARTAV
ncbi:MAG: sigma 54-interacting transcriptional regulator [Planctomycetota bacterium]|jgi:two-component system response regulator AtoC